MKKVQFGTVSHGTLRIEDLIPAFAAELNYYAGKEPGNDVLISRAGALPMSDDDEYLDIEDAQDVLEHLFDALDQLAPPYAYFGAHPGDGSDFGFWLSDCIEHDFDGLKVDDTSKVPADYDGEVLHINDHGNATLYAAQQGKLTEIWAVV